MAISCQKNEIVDKSVISIGFNAELSKLTKTSGVAGADLANLQDQDFRVWAYCAFEDSVISDFQAINSPDKTLAELGENSPEVDRVFLELNECIKSLL